MPEGVPVPRKRAYSSPDGRRAPSIRDHHRSAARHSFPELLSETPIDVTPMHGKVVLVLTSGATANLELAHQLATLGADLVVHGSSNDVGLKRVLGGIGTGRSKISYYSNDISSIASIERMLEKIAEEQGPVEFVLNMSGKLLRGTSRSRSDTEKMFAYAIFVDQQQRRTAELYREALRGQRRQ